MTEHVYAAVFVIVSLAVVWGVLKLHWGKRGRALVTRYQCKRLLAKRGNRVRLFGHDQVVLRAPNDRGTVEEAHFDVPPEIDQNAKPQGPAIAPPPDVWDGRNPGA